MNLENLIEDIISQIVRLLEINDIIGLSQISTLMRSKIFEGHYLLPYSRIANHIKNFIDSVANIITNIEHQQLFKELMTLGEVTNYPISELARRSYNNSTLSDCGIRDIIEIYKYTDCQRNRYLHSLSILVDSSNVDRVLRIHESTKNLTVPYYSTNCGMSKISYITEELKATIVYITLPATNLAIMIDLIMTDDIEILSRHCFFNTYYNYNTSVFRVYNISRYGKWIENYVTSRFCKPLNVASHLWLETLSMLMVKSKVLLHLQGTTIPRYITKYDSGHKIISI